MALIDQKSGCFGVAITGLRHIYKSVWDITTIPVRKMRKLECYLWVLSGYLCRLYVTERQSSFQKE